MEKLTRVLFGAFLITSIGLLSSCGDDEPEPEPADPIPPKINIIPEPGFLSGADETVTPEEGLQIFYRARKGDAYLNTINFEVDGNSLEGFPRDLTGDEIIDAPGKYWFNAPFEEGDYVYTFTVTDNQERTTDTSFTLTVDASDLNVENQGTIHNSGGDQNASYDLVFDEAMFGGDPNPQKDLSNQTEVMNGDEFNQGWTSLNGTMFLKQNDYDYANASFETAKATYEANSDNATETVENVAVDDIYIARLRGFNKFVIIKVDEVNDDGNASLNDSIVFSYKKSED